MTAADAVDALRKLGLDYGFVLAADERASFVHGMGVTLELSVATVLGSLACGVVLAALLVSPSAALARPARAFVELTRNTPTLVQLFCAFLVVNMLISAALRDLGGNPLTPFIWSVIVISLHKGAFHAEALRAGLEAVPRATLEAAQSLGYSRRQRLWHVQLPLAVRFALPALVNNLVDLVKMTTVASAIAVGDVTYASIMIWTQRDNVLELMILILLFFGALTFTVNLAGRWLENRLRIPGYGH
ncbi:amino acid ABC transporter permease [Burkholderia sp. Bp8998]|uniref:amino acid ABC transporter permease n=1 Tax=Burkholderia sp. Bp8998 TaxID=2184557 RepID=UPI000F5A67EF|nr:amino acid ABC transporter permease [Burkholderia sp. Bp8998]RQS21320.1 amino acid ABC transporter permease [Burkholderia sp. Bp8998]